MAGRQVVEMAESYKPKALNQRIPPEKRAQHTIRAINKRGTTVQQKEHVEKLATNAEVQRKKKLRSDKYTEVSLDEYTENAKKCTTEFDKAWQDKDHLNDLAKINTLLKKAHWQGVKVDDGLFEDVERVFPDFWKTYKRELDKKKTTPRKGTMLKSTGDYKTSLVDFTKLVIAISKGKAENRISTNRRKGELERAGITEELILMEFCKFDKSETLKKKEQAESEKYNKTKAIFEANGTNAKGQKQISFQRHTVKYRHPSVHDSNDEEFFGPA